MDKLKKKKIELSVMHRFAFIRTISVVKICAKKSVTCDLIRFVCVGGELNGA